MLGVARRAGKAARTVRCSIPRGIHDYLCCSRFRWAASLTRDLTGFHAGRPPRNKGMRSPADPPTVEAPPGYASERPSHTTAGAPRGAPAQFVDASSARRNGSRRQLQPPRHTNPPEQLVRREHLGEALPGSCSARGKGQRPVELPAMVTHQTRFAEDPVHVATSMWQAMGDPSGASAKLLRGLPEGALEVIDPNVSELTTQLAEIVTRNAASTVTSRLAQYAPGSLISRR